MIVKSIKQPHFYFLCPYAVGAKGGGEIYTAFLLQAWQELYPEAEYDVFVRYGNAGLENLRNWKFLPQTRFHYLGEKYYEQYPKQITEKWNKRLNTSLSSAKIMGLAIKDRPTLIVATELYTYSVMCDRLKQLAGIPYWVLLYGIEAWTLKNNTYKTILRHADRVVSCSSYTRDRVLEQKYLDPAQISALPSTFHANLFQIQSKPDYLLERYNLSLEQPVIFTVGRLESEFKGYNNVLKALPQIRNSIPNVRYILAGKGGDRPRIESLMQNLGLQDCVTLAGFVPDNELNDHYNLCDVFAMPSKGEGFGIVYLEAMACGKPVLGGNKDGAVEPLANGELGCLVDPDDVEAIANSLIQILQRTYPNSLIYQPEQLRHKAIELFGYDRFCETLAELNI